MSKSPQLYVNALKNGEILYVGAMVVNSADKNLLTAFERNTVQDEHMQFSHAVW